MRKGFTQTTLGVLAAALLSGGVYAGGPTIDDFASFIVTDKMNETDVTASPLAPFDEFTNTTQNIYRFSNAVNVASMVNYAGDLTDVNYLFTETDMLSMTQRTGVDRRILINDSLAFDTAAVPTIGDINTANLDVVNAGSLDFRDLYYTTWSTSDISGVPSNNPDPGAGASSGTNANLDAVANTGGNMDGVLDPGELYDDSTMITLFVTDDLEALEMDMTSFSIITTNDPAFMTDSISGAGVILTFEDCWDDFSGWSYFAANGGDIFFDSTTVPASCDYFRAVESATPSPTPVSAPDDLGGTYNAAPGGTTAVGITTSPGTPAGAPPYDAFLAPEFGTWQSGNAFQNSTAFVNVTADNFYLLRWDMTSPTTTAQTTLREVVRFRAGAADTSTVGSMTDELNRGLNNFEGDRVHRSYFYAHEDGKLYTYLDALDFGITDIGSDFTLNSVEVFRFSRADLEALGGETVVFNQGAASFATSDGSTPPATGQVGFDLATTWEGSDFGTFFPAIAAARPIDFSAATADALTITAATVPANTAHEFARWETTGTVTASTSEAVSATNGELVVMDVWLRSPDAATADNDLPSMRIGMNAFDVYNGTDAGGGNVTQGRTVTFNFDAHNKTGLTDALGNPNDPLLALGTSSRRYTVAIEPQITSVAQAAGADPMELRLVAPAMTMFDGICDDLFGITPEDNGTVITDRVVVTKFPVPASFTTDVAGTCSNP